MDAAEIANGSFHVAWKDGERVFCRGWHKDSDGNTVAVLAVRPSSEHPHPAVIDHLAHEYGWKDELDSAWALRPLDLVHEGGRTILVLEDPGGEPLAASIGLPMGVGSFLRLAISIAAAVGKLHRGGLVHKDIKPQNIIVDHARSEVRLTGFGIASRLRRERQTIQPPETIAGTLAYMAPEQTGWMNRSIDSRSDLYALGVTLYEMLTGSLPFTASDPMEWVHCHIARKPMSAADRVGSIPSALSMIIMKLLAKTAEDRYQTAGGLAWDLRQCLAEFEGRGRIEAFPLGRHDTADQLMIPEKLYGREREIETLLASFDRIVEGGVPELVLVSGYSGIGKSSVVNELHRLLVPPRGLFSSGKFDQYKRDIPYSTLAQAFQGLIRPLLGKSDAVLAGWRAAFEAALAPNAQLMIDLVPELKLIIGDQPAVPELGPQDAQRRFQRVFHAFVRVFAQQEHPLALFLDDLQWLDAATLDMIEYVLTQPDLKYLMLIGAYRDNEVDSAHPLMRKLEAIRRAEARVEEIRLAPLGSGHLRELMTDALRCAPASAGELADLLHEKTAGNPFFVIQSLHTLADEGLLTFDVDAARWSWDLARVHAKGYTDNVVDLLVRKLVRRPERTQEALQQFACLGTAADTSTLAIVLGTSPDEVHLALWDALTQDLVEHRGDSYRFIHDRVREAAYSMIPEASRAGAHLRIGRLLTEATSPEQRENAIFEIVSQLNRGTVLIASREEREQVAELNLVAGKRAKTSTAYASALSYFRVAGEMLADDRWTRCHELSFQLEAHQAECEYLTGELATAEERLAALSGRAADAAKRAVVACLRMDLYTTLDRSDRAVEVGLGCLRHLGIEWSPHPTEEEVREEYARIWTELGSRKIEELIELPLMRDPASLGTLDVLTKILPPALFTDANLFAVACCRAINLSLGSGNSDGSCVAYVWLAMIAGPRFGQYKAAFEFGRLGCELVEKRGLNRFEARTRLWFAQFSVPWAKHILECRGSMRRAFEVANRDGDLTIAGYACNNLNTNLLAAGDPLVETQRETEHGFDFAQKARFGFVADIIAGQLGLIRTLRGLTPKFGCFDDGQFDESQFEHHLASDGTLALPECWYWTRKLQARFFAGDYRAAVDAALNAERLLWTTPSIFEKAEVYFYGALARAASCDGAGPDERRELFEAITALGRQNDIWAENCPENFENRATLVQAEIARIEDRAFDATTLYDQAIRSAQANSFVHNEALAYELASRFYKARGFSQLAHLYLRKSRSCYLQWGADGKVRQLDELYPHLMEDQTTTSGVMSTIRAPVEHLDLATIVKVSQAISGEIVQQRLVDTLMRMAVEQAGAERGLLIVARAGKPQVEAEATSGGDTLIFRSGGQPVTTMMLPESVLHYVLRSQEIVILGDAVTESPFDTDPYVRERRARSILCLPLITQAKLVGVLYLENNLTPHVFAPARIAVLKLVASQAAIALENSRLYSDLQERESKIRRLVDANIIGILIFDLEGPIIEANDAFLRMVGYDREDLALGRIRWTDLTAPEWRDRNARVVEEVKTTGVSLPYEKEYLRKNGTRVPVLVGATGFEEAGNQGVAFVLDLTERRHAESEARESERRYRETQMELAHANRIATMGQLTASLAHEVNQPITAMIGNAEASLRWLAHQPPDLDEVRRLLERIARDGRRVGDIVERTRNLVKKAPLRMERLEVNGLIGEVIELTRGEAAKSHVSVRTKLAEGLPLVEADRIQLQQVMLNLIVNAVHAMHEVGGGRRELVISSAMSSSSGVLLSVRDTGRGISPEQLERLFDPFYTTKSDGMGMGLSICRSIVEGHGGKIWAAANLPHGAAFHFTIPRPGNPGADQ